MYSIQNINVRLWGRWGEEAWVEIEFEFLFSHQKHQIGQRIKEYYRIIRFNLLKSVLDYTIFKKVSDSIIWNEFVISAIGITKCCCIQLENPQEVFVQFFFLFSTSICNKWYNCFDISYFSFSLNKREWK